MFPPIFQVKSASQEREASQQEKYLVNVSVQLRSTLEACFTRLHLDKNLTSGFLPQIDTNLLLGVRESKYILLLVNADTFYIVN